MEENHVRRKWDKIYSNTQADVAPVACEVLTEYQHLLPASANALEVTTALDVACGLGGNALFLAKRGFSVTAVDISAVAIERIESYQLTNIKTLCSAIDSTVLQALVDDVAYDVVVVSRYLDRLICGSLIDALRPGGLLFYQTFTQEKVNPESGPGNPAYLLASNELLSLFKGLRVLAFSDQGRVGTLDEGFRNQCYLVAQKE